MCNTHIMIYNYNNLYRIGLIILHAIKRGKKSRVAILKNNILEMKTYYLGYSQLLNYFK